MRAFSWSCVDGCWPQQGWHIGLDVLKALGVTPLYIGPKDQQLFVTLHLPESGIACRHAVLMCNPFGQEAIRTHRLSRVLADRLARNGVATMRFEYYGTGDSAGEDDSADMTHWVANMELAHQELQKHVGGVAIRWFGPRLGANVVLRTLENTQVKPAGIVLWDPIVNGALYTQSLNLEHKNRLKSVFRRPDFPWSDWQMESLNMSSREASGFPMAAELLTQLHSIDLTSHHLPNDIPCVVICDSTDHQTANWISGEAKTPSLQVVELKATFSWTEYEAQEGAIVPAKALQCLMRVLSD